MSTFVRSMYRLNKHTCEITLTAPIAHRELTPRGEGLEFLKVSPTSGKVYLSRAWAKNRTFEYFDTLEEAEAASKKLQEYRNWAAALKKAFDEEIAGYRQQRQQAIDRFRKQSAEAKRRYEERLRSYGH
jgi:selenocysteine-specific translation elongation factor